MSTMQDAVAKLAGTFQKDPVSIVLCTVDSVDNGAQTCDCTPIGGDATTSIPSVQLTSEANDSFTIFPSVGSTVLVCFSIRNGAYIMTQSDIDDIVCVVNNVFQFNDGSYGGLTRSDKLTIKLNNIESLLNNLIVIFNAHTHPVSGASTLIPTTQETNTLNLTQQSQIENTRITHGK
jgi:hypothetical protein